MHKQQANKKAGAVALHTGGLLAGVLPLCELEPLPWVSAHLHTQQLRYQRPDAWPNCAPAQERARDWSTK
jgi:hypothetical protein